MTARLLIITLAGSTYQWEPEHGAWKLVAGNAIPDALPRLPHSQVPDVAGYFAANPRALAPWTIAQAPTPLPPTPDEGGDTPPRVY